MPPTLPNATDLQGPVEIYDYVVRVEPLFFPVMLFAFWIIMLTSMLRFGASRAFTYASLVTFIPAVGISLLGWMSGYYLYLFGVFVAIGLFWRSLESGEGN